MPHLSPLSWLMAPIMFFFILISIKSSMWWSTSPKFMKPSTSAKENPFKPWKWN